MITRALYQTRYVCAPETAVPATIKHYQDLVLKAYQSPLRYLRSLLHRKPHEKIRIKRSDRYGVIVDVLQALLGGMDMQSLTVGRPYQDQRGKTQFYCKGIQDLASRLGHQYHTVKRAIQDLVKAGYLDVKRRCGQDKQGNIISFFSLRQFTKKFFMELDHGQQLMLCMNFLRKKSEEKSVKKVRAIFGFFAPGSQTNTYNSSPSTKAENRDRFQRKKMAEEKQLLAQKAMEISKRTGRSVSDCCRELTGQS